MTAEDDISIERRIAEAVKWIDRERPRAGFFAWPAADTPSRLRQTYRKVLRSWRPYTELQ